jgi:tripartite-type tricarboxylate transporter receptor subunit TctC
MTTNWKIVTGIAAALVLGLAAAAPESRAGPVYDGKDVTLIVPNSPAGMMSQYAQTLAPLLAKNLGASNVRVENQPGAGSLKGTNNLWKSDPDGMTIGFTNVPTLLIAQLAESPGVQFDATKFVFLGRAASDPRLIVVGSQSTIKTVDDIRKLGRPLAYASQGTDEDFYTMVVLANALGYELKVITGYEGAADTALAVIKGDADGQMTGWPGSAAAIASGEMRPVVFATTERQDMAPDVPTVFEYLQDESKKKQLEAISAILALSRGFFGPPDMDPAAVEEMRAAIEKTLTDPEVVKDMESKGMPIVFLSGAEQQELVQQVFDAAGDLTPVFKEALARIQ